MGVLPIPYTLYPNPQLSLSQHSYSTQPDHFRSPAFSVEPRRTPLSRSVSAFDVTISSRVGVAASLCNVRFRLTLPRSCPLQQSGFFTRTALRTVSLRFSSAGGCRLHFPDVSTLLFGHVRSCYFDVAANDHLMSVINLSSPTAVAGRILPANSSQTQCLQSFNPLVAT